MSSPEYVYVEAGVRVPVCVDCGETFDRTPLEHTARRDPALPLSGRCPACRERRRAELNARRLADYGTGPVGPTPWPAPRPESARGRLHPASCAACGLSIRVPFRPSGDRPLFCRTCLGERNGR